MNPSVKSMAAPTLAGSFSIVGMWLWTDVAGMTPPPVEVAMAISMIAISVWQGLQRRFGK